MAVGFVMSPCFKMYLKEVRREVVYWIHVPRLITKGKLFSTFLAN